MDDHQWKQCHATRLLCKRIKKESVLSTLDIKSNKKKGVVLINDFECVRIKADLNGQAKYSFIKRNFDDIGHEGLEATVRGVVDDFSKTFH